MVDILDEKEISRLKKLPIMEKVSKGFWYQYGREPLLKNKVKANIQNISTLNEVAKKDFESAKEHLLNLAPNIDVTTEIYFPINTIEYPEKLSIGPNSFVNSGLQIISAGKVNIGSNTFIGPNCHLFTVNHHPTDVLLRREGWQYDGTIVIGNDCWIGGDVIILPDVTIGNGVVIGAGSVVTKDIPSFCTAVGNPAKIIKFPKELNV